MARPLDDWELLHVGKVGRPHGIRGELRVWPLEEGSETLLGQEVIFVGPDPSKAEAYTVRRARSGGGHVVLALDGVRYRDQADALKGWSVFIKSTDLVTLDDPDEFYAYELQGLHVVDEANQPVGTVQGLEEAGTQDLLVIREPDGQTEVTVPFVEPLVVSVELEEGRLVVDLPEGLLEATRSPAREKP
ncbi:MAG: ribosome maturation factor RimM [Myxococcota bacterium]